MADIADEGAKDPLFLNTRLQYEPYTSMTVRSPAFPRSYPLPGNTALPQDHGLEAWTVDPAYASGRALLANGTQYFAAFHVRNTVTVTRLHFLVATGATNATAGQNWIGLYDSSGNRLRQAGIDAEIVSAGPRRITIASQRLTPGVYWIALLCKATTAVTLARAGGVSAAGNSMNLAAEDLRYFVNGTGRTTLAASVSPASNTVSGSVALCAGVER